MFVVYEKTYGFVVDLYPASTGITTRDTTAYPSATYADVTLTDNQSQITALGTGTIFKVDDVVTPTALVQVIPSQLAVIDPPSESPPATWTSGIANMLFVDDGAGGEKQDIRIEGIHTSATKLVIVLFHGASGQRIEITATRGGSTTDYTWGSGDDFLFVHMTFDNEAIGGNWWLFAQDDAFARYHDVAISPSAPPATVGISFQVVRRPVNMRQEISVVETPDGAIKVFTFAGSKTAALGTAEVYIKPSASNRYCALPSEYTEDVTSGAVAGITFTTAPATGDVIKIVALRAATPDYVPSFNAGPAPGGLGGPKITI